MLTALIISSLLSALITCSSEGNIHLLEDETAAAIRACTPYDSTHSLGNSNQRSRRSNRGISKTNGQYDNQYSRRDNNTKDTNQYNHQRRNTSDLMNQRQYSNTTDNDVGYETQYGNENAYNIPKTNWNNFNISNSNTFANRTKRSDRLWNKSETDQCLSQCVFANLHVVDTRGIPREVDLWNKVQASVASQQSRAILQDQIRSCFQELQTEAEDNSCSYSNKLERCLMLRFSDRKKERNKKKEFRFIKSTV